MQVRLFPLFLGSELTDLLLAATLSLDLEGFIINSIAVTRTISTSIDEVRRILLILDRLKLVLSTLITPGLNADVDSICYGILSLFPSSAIAGLSRCVYHLACEFLVIYNRNYSIKATTVYQTSLPQDVWSISPNVSAARALAIIVVLRAMSLFEGTSEGHEGFHYLKLMYIRVQNSR
jgi:WD repeat-containing protein 7